MTDATIMDDFITKYSRWGKWGDDDQHGPQPGGLRSNPQLVTTATGRSNSTHIGVTVTQTWSSGSGT